MEKLPKDFDMSTMKAGRDSLNVAMLIHLTQQRFPWINERTPMTITTGIMAFTPDGKGMCGPLPEVAGLFHCSCCSGHGIMQSPIVGKVMADLIVDGKTKYNIEFMKAERFHDLPGYQQRADIKRHCYEMYASYYGQVEKPKAVAT
jgi:glycine/D-amino acid oxidase-like deaminating enzyme